VLTSFGWQENTLADVFTLEQVILPEIYLLFYVAKRPSLKLKHSTITTLRLSVDKLKLTRGAAVAQWKSERK
jgi:hypothetical protein